MAKFIVRVRNCSEPEQASGFHAIDIILESMCCENPAEKALAVQYADRIKLLGQLKTEIENSAITEKYKDTNKFAM